MKQKTTAYLTAVILGASLLAGCGSTKNAASTETVVSSEAASAAGTELSEAAAAVESGDAEGSNSTLQTSPESAAADEADAAEADEADAAAGEADTADAAAEAGEADAAETNETNTAGSAASDAKQTGQINPSLPTKISASDGTCSIYVPAAWTDLSGQLDASDSTVLSYPLTAGNPNAPAYLMAKAEAKEGSSLASFDEYVSFLNTGLMEDERFANTQIILSAVDFPMSQEGLNAKKTKFTATYAKEGETCDIVYLTYAVESADRYYQLNFWTDAEHASTEEVIFDAAAQTFREGV